MDEEADRPGAGAAAQEGGSAGRDPLLGALRELAEAYHAFAAYSAAHVREMGLTPAQFDVIATLGNTQGMALSQLAQRTLITKGTLTGVIDRLEAKGLVRREVQSADRRSFRAVLTPAGEALFARVFPAHIEHIRALFQDGTIDLGEIRRALRVLRERFRAPV